MPNSVHHGEKSGRRSESEMFVTMNDRECVKNCLHAMILRLFFLNIVMQFLVKVNILES
jgi:hypothetical protein